MRKTENILAGTLLAVSVYVFVVTAGYPSVYGSLGPAFYPRLIAIALFVFCVIQLVQINVFKRFVKKPGTPGETQAKKETLAHWVRLAFVVAALVILVLVMQYVHVLVGIALFLFGYLTLMSKVRWTVSLLITAVGTAIIYASILVLHIPL